jgi:hypothetical protein
MRYPVMNLGQVRPSITTTGGSFPPLRSPCDDIPANRLLDRYNCENEEFRRKFQPPPYSTPGPNIIHEPPVTTEEPSRVREFPPRPPPWTPTGGRPPITVGPPILPPQPPGVATGSFGGAPYTGPVPPPPPGPPPVYPPVATVDRYGRRIPPPPPWTPTPSGGPISIKEPFRPPPPPILPPQPPSVATGAYGGAPHTGPVPPPPPGAPPVYPPVATPGAGAGYEIYGARCYRCPDGSYRMLSSFDARQPMNSGCRPTLPEDCQPKPTPTPSLPAAMWPPPGPTPPPVATGGFVQPISSQPVAPSVPTPGGGGPGSTGMVPTPGGGGYYGGGAPMVATQGGGGGQCPPGQFWDGSHCRGSIDLTRAGLISAAGALGPSGAGAAGAIAFPGMSGMLPQVRLAPEAYELRRRGWF